MAALIIAPFHELPNDESLRLNVGCPFQELPETQLKAFREVQFITEKLGDLLSPVMMADEASDEHLARYDEMLRSLETRQDITWIILEETGLASLYRRIMNQRMMPWGIGTVQMPDGSQRRKVTTPLTDDERRFDQRYNIFERLKALKDWHYRVKGLSKKGRRIPGSPGLWKDGRLYKEPKSWTDKFLQERIPPFIETSGQEEDKFTLTESEEQEAQNMLDDFLVKRSRVISYLRANPPLPESWELLSDHDQNSGDEPQHIPVFQSWRWYSLDVPWEWGRGSASREEWERQEREKNNRSQQQDHRNQLKHRFVEALNR